MSGLDDEEKGELEGEEDVESTDEEGGEPEDFDEAVDEEIDDEEDPEAFDDGEGFESDEDVRVVDEALSHKDQNARALAIRRAIEERLEAKRLSRDLDYLDLDLDSED